jgi:hypothetical protein
MLLLTWHGTILRVEQAQPRLIHAPLVPARSVSRDYALELPPEGLVLPLPIDGNITVIEATRPGTVHLTRGKHFLCAEPASHYPGFDRERGGQWETFLAITPAEASALRALLAGAWQDEAGEPVEAATLLPGFRLLAGALDLDLVLARPGRAPDGGLLLPANGDNAAARRLWPRQAPPQAPELHLNRGAPAKLPQAASPEAFRATPSILTLPTSDEFYFPPLTPSLAERGWTLDRAWPGPPPLGPQRCQSRVVHQGQAFVLLDRFIEGTVIDTRGVLSEPGYLDNLGSTLPPHFAREGAELFLSTAAFQRAPILRGPHAVFYGGYLTDPLHWLINAIVPLCMMAPHLPPETTLLLPASLGRRPAPAGAGPLDILDAFGFGPQRRVEVDTQVCVAEDLYWPDQCGLHQLPASALQTARARIFARQPTGAAEHPPGRRIFLRPAGKPGIANLEPIETIARDHGLEIISLDRMSFPDRVTLFSQASLVAGVHGGDLANILFCAPGTAVLEFSPACQYRPQYNILAGKLDLIHAVLPCPTEDDRFETDLKIKPLRLVAMLKLLGVRAGLGARAGRHAHGTAKPGGGGSKASAEHRLKQTGGAE